MSNRIFEAFAPQYWAAGLPVIPLRERDKMPDIKQWQAFGSRMPSDAEQQSWLANFPFGNVGLPFGSASGLCAVDIDTDDEEVATIIREICGPTPYVRVGKKGCGLIYRWDGQGNFKLRGAKGGMICEFLGLGNQMVLPPSVHPDTGLPYQANRDLWEVLDDITALPLDVEERLKTALVASGHVAPARRSTAGSNALGSAFTTGSRYDGFLQEHLLRHAAEIEAAEAGDRNNSLFRNAAAMANHVAAAGVDWEPFAAVLLAAAGRAGLDRGEADATVLSAWERGSQTPTAWIMLSRDWVYVAGMDTFRHSASGAQLKRIAFQTEFASINPSRDMNVARFLTANRFIDIVQDVAYDPRADFGVFEKAGRWWFNTYTPSGVVAEDGDATPFIEFLEYLIPEELERAHMLKVLAHLVRNPGEKLAHAVLLGSKVHGVGKSTLVQILMELIGTHNCRKTTSDELASQYQSYIDGKLLVLVEELDLGQGLKTYNKLKDLITAETSPMRKLYENARDVPNLATFFFLTNMDLPLLIEEHDRRFWVVQSPAEKKPEGYWTEFNAWWKSSLGVIRGLLEQVDLSGFNRFAPPPMTAAKAALIERSRNPIVQDLLEMIDDREAGLRCDIVTRDQVQEALRRRHPMIGRRAVDGALAEIGGVQLGQHRLSPARTSFRALGSADRPSLWAIRHVKYWIAAEPKARVAEYLAEESLFSTLPDLPETFGLLPLNPSDWTPAQRVGSETRAEELAALLNSRAGADQVGSENDDRALEEASPV